MVENLVCEAKMASELEVALSEAISMMGWIVFLHPRLLRWSGAKKNEEEKNKILIQDLTHKGTPPEKIMFSFNHCPNYNDDYDGNFDENDDNKLPKTYKY